MFFSCRLEHDDEAMRDCAANRVQSIEDHILIAESGKLKFLVQLMSRLKKEKHRTLIFSQSRKMIDIIQKVNVTKSCQCGWELSGSVLYHCEYDNNICINTIRFWVTEVIIS